MLNVQKYLKENPIEKLTEDLGIKITNHPTEPLIILNYNQIDSPRFHPVVKECRGLVLRSDNFDLVAKSFDRFFNLGEFKDEIYFDYSDFTTTTKEDGSLIVLYNFNDQWHAHTRGSFALEESTNGIRWQELIRQALVVENLKECDRFFNPQWTYVFELCSPYNKIVRTYSKPQMFLISIFDKEKELTWKETRDLTGGLNHPVNNQKIFFHPFIKQVDWHHFNSLEKIEDFIKEQETKDKTFEGVVIRDQHNTRLKIKSSTYLSLHRLKGESGNLFLPKYLIDFALSGETEEVLTYFPEIEEPLNNLSNILKKEFDLLNKIWDDTRNIESQKDFAIEISKRTKLTSILFQTRKLSGDHNVLKKIFRDSKDLLLKKLF